MEKEYHRLLVRQFKNYLDDSYLNDPKIKGFLNCINNAYNDYEGDYKQLEHILELSNKESFKALKDLQFALNQVASVFTTNALGEIQEANEIFFNLTHYKINKVINTSYTQVFEQSKEAMKKMVEIRRSLLEKQIWRGELTIVTAHGKNLYTSTSIIPIYDNDTDVNKYMFISFDISEEKKAKENLTRNEEKYRSIISNMNLGLLEVDLDETIIMVNQSFCDMSGYMKEELIGKKTDEVILNAETKLIIEEKNLMRKEKQSDVYEMSVLNKKGENKYWLISGAPLFNDNGNLIGSIGIHLDITERKMHEHQMQEVLHTLQKVNKELNDFAYIVSHDLKAPLRGIGSLATWLENDYADKLDQEGKETLRLLVQRTQRMHNLIDGILDYSKIGRTEEHKEMLNTNNSTLQVIDILAIPKNIQVTIDNPLPVVFYDRTKFEQVMVNLLSNAVQFLNKEQGIIHIFSKEKDDRFEISVSDNGPGIEKAHFNKIFQIFQTLNPRDIVESTGVGLSIVKKIVESYGGEISVESQIGIGTTLTFSVLKH